MYASGRYNTRFRILLMIVFDVFGWHFAAWSSVEFDILYFYLQQKWAPFGDLPLDINLLFIRNILHRQKISTWLDLHEDIVILTPSESLLSLLSSTRDAFKAVCLRFGRLGWTSNSSSISSFEFLEFEHIMHCIIIRLPPRQTWSSSSTFTRLRESSRNVSQA